jgi:hypothetical protein
VSQILVVFLVGALAILVARGCGAILGVCWRQRRTEGLHPWGVAAPQLVAALPASGLVAGLATLLPSVPWIWMTAGCACQVYSGAHLCPFHPAMAIKLLWPLGALAVLVVGTAGRVLADALLQIRDLKHLASEASPHHSGVWTVDGGGRPLVFVAGFRRPRLFVEETWWSSLALRDRRAIQAHEQAHIEARDSRTFVWLNVLLALFAPAARGSILTDWLTAAEMRADAAAAKMDGDPLFVAEVLCRYVRAAAPFGAVALGGRALSARIDALVDGTAPAPSSWSSGGVAALVLGGLVGGHFVHRALETCLAFLS